MVLAGSALVFVGCAQEQPRVNDAGYPGFDFQPRERSERCTGQGDARTCRVVWIGDSVIGDQVAARDLVYEGDDGVGAGSTVRVAWVPATRRVIPVEGGINRQWWFVAAAVLIVAGAGIEEWGRHRMRIHGRRPAPE